MEEHWFDALNKALVRARPRRSLLGAAALASGLGLGGPLSAEAKKGKKGKDKRKKKDRRKNKKDKGRPKVCGPDIDALCENSFSTPEDVQFCKDKCGRCKEAGTPFCIHFPDDEHDVLHATCCHDAEECCGGPIGRCCTSDRCCDGERGTQFCAPTGEVCCRDGSGGSFSCEAPYVPNRDTCVCECPNYCYPPAIQNPDTCQCEYPDDECGGTCVGPWEQCCHGRCVDIRHNSFHCGGCDRPCWDQPHTLCCDGECTDVWHNDDHCGGSCAPCPPGRECCYSTCIDPIELECCRGQDPIVRPWCSVTGNAECCFSSSGQPSCCIDGVPA